MENDDPLSGSTEAEQDPYDWNAWDESVESLLLW